MRARKCAWMTVLLLVPFALQGFIIEHSASVTSGSIRECQPGDWVRDDLCRIGHGITNNGVPPGGDWSTFVAVFDFEPLIPADYWGGTNFVTNISIEVQTHSSMIVNENYTISGAVTGAWEFFLLYRDCLPGSRTDWGPGVPNWDFYTAGNAWQVAGCRGAADRSQTPFLTVYFTNWPCNGFLAAQRHSTIQNIAEFDRWRADRGIAHGIAIAAITNEMEHSWCSQSGANSMRLIFEYGGSDIQPPQAPTGVTVDPLSTAPNVIVDYVESNLSGNTPANCMTHVWAATQQYPGTATILAGEAMDMTGAIPDETGTPGTPLQAQVTHAFLSGRGSDVVNILMNVIADEGLPGELFGGASAAAYWVVPNAGDAQVPGDIVSLTFTLSNGAGDGSFKFGWLQPTESCPDPYLNHVETRIYYLVDVPITDLGAQAVTNCGRIAWSQSGVGTPLTHVASGFDIGRTYYFVALSEDQFGNQSLNFTPTAPAFLVATTGTGDPDPPTVARLHGNTLPAGSPLTYRVADTDSPINIGSLTNSISIDGGAITYYPESDAQISHTGSGLTYDVTFTPSTPFTAGQIVQYTVSVWDTSLNPAPNRGTASFSVTITGTNEIETDPPTITPIFPSTWETNSPIVFTVVDEGTNASGVNWASVVLTVDGVDYSTGDPELNVSSSTCTYIPAVNYREGEILCQIVAADYNANAATNSFPLEVGTSPVIPVTVKAGEVIVAPPGADVTITSSEGLPDGKDTVRLRTLMGVVIGEAEVTDVAEGVVVKLSDDMATGLYVIEATEGEEDAEPYRALLLVRPDADE